MRWLLAVLLLTAGIAGCLGSEEGSTVAGQSATAEGGCDEDSATGTVRPANSVTVEATAGGAPAHADIAVTSEGAGSVELTLQRGTDEVWSEELTGVGTYDYSTNVDGLAAGDYTLVASTHEGYRDVTLELGLVWGTGSC